MASDRPQSSHSTNSSSSSSSRSSTSSGTSTSSHHNKSRFPVKSFYRSLKTRIHDRSFHHHKGHHHHHHRHSKMPPNIPQDLFNQFSAVDSYINSSLLPHDAGLESALNNNHAKNLDEIDVAPNQGKLLYLLAKINHASRILEVGTLGGYSAIWFAKAVTGKENAKVITCEIDPDSAKIAESNIANAGFSSTVEVRVGPALETLSAMEKDENTGTFDMVFIDADKENNVNYIKYALKFAKVGTLIVVDNVVRRGRIMDSENKEPSIEGTRKTYEFLGQEKRVESTAVQTVGLKGWDGFALAYVVE